MVFSRKSAFAVVIGGEAGHDLLQRKCLLMAQSGHDGLQRTRPLSGVKQTWPCAEIRFRGRYRG